MLPTINIPVIGLIFVFLFGALFGWFLGRRRLQGGLSISVHDPGVTSGANRTFAISKTVRSLSLKCECGSTWRFHETSGHADQGSQPMPTGDSFTCPSCGRSIDLRELRKALADAK
jgi:hypothetical protein